MNFTYDIKDTSNGMTLLFIQTELECAEPLKAIKSTTEKLWYDYSEEPSDYQLTEEELDIVESTVNGDWVEIFERLLVINHIAYKVITPEDV